VFEDIRTIAVSVTSHIFETMFFTFLDPQGEGQEEEPSDFGSSSVFLKSEIGFVGKYSGKLELSVPMGLARTMVSNFIGLEEEEVLESQAVDMVSELCNMICGNLSSQLDGKNAWDLTIPKTQPVPRQEISDERKGPGITIDFDAEGQRVKLNIQLGPSGDLTQNQG